MNHPALLTVRFLKMYQDCLTLCRWGNPQDCWRAFWMAHGQLNLAMNLGWITLEEAAPLATLAMNALEQARVAQGGAA